MVQIAVGVALLAGAGLLAKGFYRLQSEGPGFDAGGVWTTAVALPRGRYPTPESWAQFEGRALEALRALPGVTAAGYTSILPFTGNNNQGSYVIDGYTPPPGSPEPHAQQRSISEGYLPALGLPVIEGRNFAASEPERVAIVDTNVAHKYWPAGQALGQRLRMNFEPRDRWYTVIGVVPPVKQEEFTEDGSKETIYFHYTQPSLPFGWLVLRTTLPADQLTGPAKAAVAALDPELALYGTAAYDTFLDRALGPRAHADGADARVRRSRVHARGDRRLWRSDLGCYAALRRDRRAHRARRASSRHREHGPRAGRQADRDRQRARSRRRALRSAVCSRRRCAP